jgi:hypothetical protein
MTKEEFIKVLARQGIQHHEEGGRLIVNEANGPISFYFLQADSMPPDVTFENEGNISLGNVKEIPQGVFFNNEGYIYWLDAGKIPGGTRFGKWFKGIVSSNKGFLDLGIPEINEGNLLTATFKYL